MESARTPSFLRFSEPSAPKDLERREPERRPKSWESRVEKSRKMRRWSRRTRNGRLMVGKVQGWVSGETKGSGVGVGKFISAGLGVGISGTSSTVPLPYYQPGLPGFRKNQWLRFRECRASRFSSFIAIPTGRWQGPVHLGGLPGELTGRWLVSCPATDGQPLSTGRPPALNAC